MYWKKTESSLVEKTGLQTFAYTLNRGCDIQLGQCSNKYHWWLVGYSHEPVDGPEEGDVSHRGLDGGEDDHHEDQGGRGHGGGGDGSGGGRQPRQTGVSIWVADVTITNVQRSNPSRQLF